jgi:hypothetical protein
VKWGNSSMEYIITSSKCNYINEYPYFVNTVFTALSLQTNFGLWTRHGLLQFPLPLLVKSNIVSATLSLYYFANDNGDPVGKTITIYKSRRQDWSSPTWNNYKSGSAWGTAGAKNTTSDIDTSLTATAVFPADFGWVNFDVSDLLDDAIDNSLDLSIRLSKAGEEYAEFRSRTYADDTSLRPKLVINYTTTFLHGIMKHQIIGG